MSKPPTLRCAVYTRKSSEEGLEQDFNSLHAQREACEAYILSQAGEGWICLPNAYDDGGISGGTMERPGLKQLLADIEARRIDVVVVYKVDRLTRSLGDFGRMVEIFDRHGVSFVSVTQAFNTTNSMGRLTLNVLLSFAQFEREVTGERIRDKIAASKKKGLWMGGVVPLGYDADGRTLKINEAEAETVRHIFARYLEVKSVHVLKRELDKAGIVSKRVIYADGRTVGARPFGRGALFALLSNPLYLGKIRHKQEVHDGLHPPIIDPAVFEAAQAIMAANRVKRGPGSQRRAEATLVGKLFDETGRPMTPVFAIGRGGKRYRYYVAAGLQRGTPDTAGAIRRLPGPQTEALVSNLVDRLVEDGVAVFVAATVRRQGLELSFGPADGVDPSQWDHALSILSQRLEPGERAWRSADDRVVVATATRVSFRGGRTTLIGTRPTPRRVDATLVTGLRKAHAMTRQARISPLQTPAECIRSRGFDSDYDTRLSRLAFLAPVLQQAILDGTAPATLRLEHLLDGEMPLSWSEQGRWAWLGSPPEA
ncbi:recombinase family protein [Brevundimonas sp.]|uniref:recombinase family protein n=1 Tax=Brevundimonas sp. TaxID=1871086 RepID=UPI00262D6248|nr:recombinase family protein [Brevundimonas sp.]